MRIGLPSCDVRPSGNRWNQPPGLIPFHDDPAPVIATWKDNALTERSAAQAHFIDLCRLLDQPTPAKADRSGKFFTFEKGASKTGGGNSFADPTRRVGAS